MNELEAELAAEVYAAIMDFSNNDERSLQSQRFQVGISEIGYCSERLRRMLDRQVPDDTDVLAAFIGTAIGAKVEEALQVLWPTALIQSEVVLQLKGNDGQVFNIPGHPDVLRPDVGQVLDVKTAYGLGQAERMGPTFSQQFQRHGYALAAFQQGLFGDRALEDVTVGNVFLDRSAKQKRAHVQLEPFNPDVIGQGIEWLESVLYAHINGEEALKEPPRQVCETTCGFFEKCRKWDTDVQGLIDDPFLLDSIAAYAKGQELSRAGDQLKNEAKAHLQDISGSTREYSLRWIHTNANEERAASSRIDLKKI